MRHVHIQKELSASAERAFAALDDHERMGSWLDASITVEKRVPDGGVGTVRRIAIGPLSFDEEIVAREAPRRIAYRIVRGLPALRHHFGEVSIDPVDEGRCIVHWRIDIESTLPGVSTLMALSLKPALARGLGKLDAQLRAG